MSFSATRSSSLRTSIRTVCGGGRCSPSEAGPSARAISMPSRPSMRSGIAVFEIRDPLTRYTDNMRVGIAETSSLRRTAWRSDGGIPKGKNSVGATDSERFNVSFCRESCFRFLQIQCHNAHYTCPVTPCPDESFHTMTYPDRARRPTCKISISSILPSIQELLHSSIAWLCRSSHLFIVNKMVLLLSSKRAYRILSAGHAEGEAFSDGRLLNGYG